MSQLLHFSCDSCGKTLKAKPELVGKKARCACGHIVRIPGPAQPVPSAGLPQGTAQQPASHVVPTGCHYCGGEATNHVTAYLFPTTADAKKAAAEEYQRKIGGAVDCKNIYVRDKNAGYGQLVEIPRCKPCRSAHSLPWKIALLAALLALPVTIGLSYAGYWPNPKTIAVSVAEPVDLGEGGKVLVQINKAAKTPEGKMASVDDDGKIQPSIYYVLMITAMVFLLPVAAVGFIAFGSAVLVQRMRLRGRGVKWKSQVKDHPLIMEQVSRGWSFQGTL
jgi:hypothetical protein